MALDIGRDYLLFDGQEAATLRVRSRPAGSAQDVFDGYAVPTAKFDLLTEEELAAVGGALVAHLWRWVLTWRHALQQSGAPPPKATDVWRRADGTDWLVKTVAAEIDALTGLHSCLCQRAA